MIDVNKLEKVNVTADEIAAIDILAETLRSIGCEDAEKAELFCYKALCRWSLYGEEPDLSGFDTTTAAMIKLTVEGWRKDIQKIRNYMIGVRKGGMKSKRGKQQMLEPMSPIFEEF